MDILIIFNVCKNGYNIEWRGIILSWMHFKDRCIWPVGQHSNLLLQSILGLYYVIKTVSFYCIQWYI